MSADSVQKEVLPVFLFSLPRSGSTLLQRLLSENNEVSTTSEPWLLLSLLYSLRARGCYTEYEHYLSVTAIEDFCQQLPGGRADYESAIKEFALSLYRKAAKQDAIYFLDKTPRYHLIANQVIDLFPEGRFIFLWRNPLAIASSMIETWASGRWKLYTYKVDLYDGLDNLIDAFLKNKNIVCAASYEGLMEDPKKEMSRIYEYLGLDIDTEKVLLGSGSELKGRLGDSAGIGEYKSLSAEPLMKWKNVMSNPLRKCWCRRYLSWIGRERLKVMGYEMDALLQELSDIPLTTKYLFTDSIRMLAGIVYAWCEPAIFRDKLRLLRRRHNVHAHR